MWHWYQEWTRGRSQVRQQHSERLISKLGAMLRQVRGELVILHEDVDLALQDIDRLLTYTQTARKLLDLPVEQEAPMDIPRLPACTFSNTQRQRGAVPIVDIHG